MDKLFLVILGYILISLGVEAILLRLFNRETNDVNNDFDLDFCNGFKVYIAGFLWPIWVVLFFYAMIKEIIKAIKEDKE